MSHTGDGGRVALAGARVTGAPGTISLDAFSRVMVRFVLGVDAPGFRLALRGSVAPTQRDVYAADVPNFKVSRAGEVRILTAATDRWLRACANP